MATATRETIIANPARKKRKNVARKMSLKQKAAFGSKRVRAAAKAALSRQKKRKRNPPRKVIAGYGSTVMNGRKRRKRNPPAQPSGHARKVITGYGSTVMNPRKRRKRANGSTRKRKAARKKNPGIIYALANPATKGRKRMARTKRRKTSRRHAAGTTRRRTRRNPGRVHHRRRSNPGGMVIKDWLSLGAGAVVGGVGATQLPQMILSTSNTGAVGYFANLAATGLLAAAAHMALKGNKALVAGVIAGGVGATIKRVIGDYSLLGSYGTSLGMGDYLTNFNFPVPQGITGPGFNAVGPYAAGTAATPVNVAGAGGGMGYLGRPLY